jgi:hypothetical protein
MSDHRDDPLPGPQRPKHLKPLKSKVRALARKPERLPELVKAKAKAPKQRPAGLEGYGRR